MFIAFTGDIDLVQVLLVAFFLFFGLLVVYLRQEDKREGYPLVSRTARHPVIGWPAPPPPKNYRLIEGGMTTMPHRWPQTPLPDDHVPKRAGAPLTVVGDPVLSQLGAGAFAMRRDDPMLMPDDKEPMLQPLRKTRAWRVHRGELDPRGMRVVARDYRPVGTVIDLWVDRDVKILRYLEVTLDAGGTVLLPIFFAHIRQTDREVRVKALKPEHFAHVPRLRHPERMSPREEDAITAFYAGGSIYADSILFA